MKAVLSKVTGGPDALVVEDIPAPVAGPGQALISVKAVGVNCPDVLMVEDEYQSRAPRPVSPGG
ncbi:MAG: NADPH:quinone oxidoreductase family protein, partial [Phenylobacterium sp.]|nr:NADPH:quinone oxidoreductase family protein [Phenylobacterium sp.]